MKKRRLLTAAFALMMSVGVVSCASDKEKMEKEEQQRQEEIQKAEEKQQKMEDELRQQRDEIDAMKGEQAHEQMVTSHSSSDKPWANQQVSLDNVEKVQEKLNAEGYSAGAVDGLIGPNTSGAIEKFQSDKGLSASGDLTQETVDALGLDFDISGGLAE